MSVIREVHAEGWCVRLDLDKQVLHLEVPEFIVDHRREGEEGEMPLLPVLPRTEDGPVSAATLLLKAKQFDDGLYAAVEFAAQQGKGRFAGKASLLGSLASTLTAGPAEDRSVAALILAACELGGLSPPTPPSLRDAVRTILQDFLRDELRSKPLGFYTWTAPLAAIFRQDRLLQGPLEASTASALVQGLDRTPDAWEAYDACLRLAARLTNPLKGPSLRDDGDERAFLPASRSHEVALVEGLYGDRPVPEGFDLMSELIRRVRSGEVSLEPAEASGWYDHQTWSLEPLLVPGRMAEAGRLDLGERYLQHLEDLFRGALALARETHVKQLSLAVAGCGPSRHRPIRIDPDLTVEPLPSVYARRATAYRFVRSVLAESFGADALQQMHRLTPEGFNEATLCEELDWMRHLFDGAAAASCRELGLEPMAESGEAFRCFAEWRGKLEGDADVSRDARMMVPVFHDLERRKTKVWVFLGWRPVPVDVKYGVEPAVLGIEPAMRPEPADRLGVLRRKYREAPKQETTEPPPVQFAGTRYEFAVPVMAEVYVERLMDRDEFRRHCDHFRTREAILANLR